MNEKNQYIKFMSDIIDSGVWAELSAGARTLYPVLLKFSDQNFKHVWPSTSTLMKLTGFKTKKSIIDAKRDLINAGLIQVKPGTGHSNSVYYFCFNYMGSKIKPLWDKNINPRDTKMETSALKNPSPREFTKKDSNQINITITNNNQSHKPSKGAFKQEKSKDEMKEILELFGHEIFTQAYSKALKNGMEKNFSYIRLLCEEILKSSLVIKKSENCDYIQSNWVQFLSWASEKLTKSSYQLLSKIEPIIDGEIIYIENNLPKILKEIILKYFDEYGNHSTTIVFSKEKENEIRF